MYSARCRWVDTQYTFLLIPLLLPTLRRQVDTPTCGQVNNLYSTYHIYTPITYNSTYRQVDTLTECLLIQYQPRAYSSYIRAYRLTRRHADTHTILTKIKLKRLQVGQPKTPIRDNTVFAATKAATVLTFSWHFENQNKWFAVRITNGWRNSYSLRWGAQNVGLLS